jgi:hypothetical protein
MALRAVGQGFITCTYLSQVFRFFFAAILLTGRDNRCLERACVNDR